MTRALAVFFALSACRGATPQGTANDLVRVDDAATRLASTLRARLQAAMQQGGPSAAAEVCAREARGIAEQVRAETGIAVGRSSLRLRSPANAPPAWVDAWLRTQGERPVAGVVGLRTIHEGRARVLRPIAVEGACLACHGAPDAIPAGVRATLAARYPTDRATGYSLGDLRGALWAEAPPR